MMELYSFSGDYLTLSPRVAQWRQSNNAEPVFSNTEGLTIGLRQDCFEVATLKKTSEHVRDNYGEFFPHLPGEKQWLTRRHQVTNLVGHLLASPRTYGQTNLTLSEMDSKPISRCQPIGLGR